MGQIFHYDSPVVHTINKIVDLVILNLLFLLCCLPLVTVGAAQTALYTAVYRRIFLDEPLWRCYWRAFFSNMKQSTALWLILAVAIAAGAAGIFFYLSLEVSKVLILLHCLLLLLGVGTAVWVFPLQARFDNRVGNTLVNALCCAVTQLPRTLCGIPIKLLPAFLFFFLPEVFLYALPLLLMIWFSLSNLMILYLFRSPLSKMEEMAHVGLDGEENRL